MGNLPPLPAESLSGHGFWVLNHDANFERLTELITARGAHSVTDPGTHRVDAFVKPTDDYVGPELEAAVAEGLLVIQSEELVLILEDSPKPTVTATPAASSVTVQAPRPSGGIASSKTEPDLTEMPFPFWLGLDEPAGKDACPADPNCTEDIWPEMLFCSEHNVTVMMQVKKRSLRQWLLLAILGYGPVSTAFVLAASQDEPAWIYTAGLLLGGILFASALRHYPHSFFHGIFYYGAIGLYGLAAVVTGWDFSERLLQLGIAVGAALFPLYVWIRAKRSLFGRRGWRTTKHVGDERVMFGIISTAMLSYAVSIVGFMEIVPIPESFSSSPEATLLAAPFGLIAASIVGGTYLGFPRVSRRVQPLMSASVPFPTRPPFQQSKTGRTGLVTAVSGGAAQIAASLEFGARVSLWVLYRVAVQVANAIHRVAVITARYIAAGLIASLELLGRSLKTLGLHALESLRAYIGPLLLIVGAMYLCFEAAVRETEYLRSGGNFTHPGLVALIVVGAGLALIWAALLTSCLTLEESFEWMSNFATGGLWRLVLMFWIGALAVTVPSHLADGMIRIGQVTIISTVLILAMIPIGRLQESRSKVT